MPRGSSDIPELKLSVLQNFMTTFMTPPELILMNLFSSSISPSSSVKWESQTGFRGMTPFVPPGSPAPKTAPLGVAQHSAEAAFWKEKMYFDEEFLNNLRKEGTEAQYLDSQVRLARELSGLKNRSDRRKEWMFAKMLTAGSFTYSVKEGYKAVVDYDLPTSHIVSLATDSKWSTGTSRDILGDVIDGKKLISDDCGGKIKWALCNSTVLKYLAQDPDVLTLLSKSHFGDGSLFSGNKNKIVGVNPKILGALLDIDNLVIYDEKYEVRAYLTGAVTGGATTTISVDDAADFESGESLKFVDTSAGTSESETISTVGVEAGTIEVSTAPSVSFKKAEDYVSMTKTFIPDNVFVMIAPVVEGQQIAEYKKAPFGLKRQYGQQTDKHDEWDPEGTYIRVRDKGLPIMYQRDAVYILTVA